MSCFRCWNPARLEKDQLHVDWKRRQVDKLKEKVLAYLLECKGNLDDGVSFHQINQVQKRITIGVYRQTLKELEEEVKIYNTIDQDHWEAF